MPEGPAARFSDKVVHPLPPGLSGTKGSPDVIIGYLPAWRGLPAAAAQALSAARDLANKNVKAAEAMTTGVSGTPAYTSALATEVAIKTAASKSIGASITAAASGGTDIHQCLSPSPAAMVPHGPGVVIDGSATVLINYMPACRQGDTILEPLGPPNKIVKGELTVIIGG